MTAVYLGARFDRRAWLLEHVVGPLHAAGHEVTSRWILYDCGDSVLGAEELAQDLAAGEIPGTECLEDIKRAEAVVILTDAPSSTGGYHVELGYALGLNKSIEVVGPALNVFHSLPTFKRYPTIADFVRAWSVSPEGVTR